MRLFLPASDLLGGGDLAHLRREAGCRETGLPRVREGCEERYACSVGAVGHLYFIFNSVSKSEAELNMVFVIRCWAGGSGKMQMRVQWR